MEYKWSVNKLTVAEDNLVIKVDLTVTATDGDNTASAAYTCNLVRGESFISYDQLTEDQVLAWCFLPEITVWTDVKGIKQTSTRLLKDGGEAQVAGQIARQMAQKVVELDLPWMTI